MGFKKEKLSYKDIREEEMKLDRAPRLRDNRSGKIYYIINTDYGGDTWELEDIYRYRRIIKTKELNMYFDAVISFEKYQEAIVNCTM